MKITIGTLKRMIQEAVKSAAAEMPRELAALTRYLPMKITAAGGAWSDSARISEKKHAEQAKMDRAWDKMMSALKAKPWKRVSGDHAGWNGRLTLVGTSRVTL